MVGQMRALTHLRTSAAAITLLTASAITFAVGTAGANPGANDATRIALDARMRNCDFSQEATPPEIPTPMLGTGWIAMHTGGSRAVAEVHLTAPNDPGTHYNVGLIEEPRSSAGSCGPGDPGTSFTGMDTDAAGVGTATVQDSVRPGTTGVWVIVERPNAHESTPAEFYTSEFLAPV
jgi:hypothetical protein